MAGFFVGNHERIGEGRVDVGEIKLNYYLVAIVDVLGQQTTLAELKEMPSTPEERRRAASILGRTLIRVQAVRKAFESFFAASKRDHPFLGSLSEVGADAVRDVTNSEVGFFHFSDSTVFLCHWHRKMAIFVYLLLAC